MSKQSVFFWGWFVGFNCGLALIVLVTTPVNVIGAHWLELWRAIWY
jgi:hypothetical protein